MKLEDIGFYTLSEERARTASAASPVERLEILITDRCNFKCPYCRGVKPNLRGEVSVDELTEILDYTRVNNIRFSGGEPTLNYDLLGMVRESKARGIERIAISTNGSAPLSFYKDLLAAGVNDFSVSLDACCGAEFQKMSGGLDRFTDVSNNIRELSKMTYVTVGVVLTGRNEQEIASIINYAYELGVSDIRVIPAAQHSKFLGGCAIPGPGKPILEYRLFNATNNIPIRGLGKKDFHRCPLVLDDVAIAGGKHFPCIIYLREGGPEIGSVGPSLRQEREGWFRGHNVYDDPICRGNCLDVCREYNNHWRDYSLGRIPLQKMPIDSFTFSRWRYGASDIKSIVGEWRFYNLTSPTTANKIRGLAVGWIPGNQLSCRPKEEDVAVLFNIKEDLGWIHMMANELWEIYSV